MVAKLIRLTKVTKFGVVATIGIIEYLYLLFSLQFSYVKIVAPKINEDGSLEVNYKLNDTYRQMHADQATEWTQLQWHLHAYIT